MIRKIHSKRAYTILLMVSIGLGALIGAVASTFMFAQFYLVQLVWEVLPDQIGADGALWYILAACTLGGLLIGVGHKYLGDYPQPIHMIMEDFKANKPTPGVESVVPGYLLSLFSLSFGGSLGPEAALLGVSVGLGSGAGGIMTRIKVRYGLDELSTFWNRLPQGLSVISGLAVFALLAKSVFAIGYVYNFPTVTYTFGDVFGFILLGMVGVLLGMLFGWMEKGLALVVQPLEGKPIGRSLVGGVTLGLLGMISPLILFSGQHHMKDLFANGAGMAGGFLILMGLLKMMATKVHVVTGWKGGEIFPVMFASAAIGLGISTYIPAIHPLVAIAATMAATTTIVLDNIWITLIMLILILQEHLILPMAVSSFVAVGLVRAYKAVKHLSGEQVEEQFVPGEVSA